MTRLREEHGRKLSNAERGARTVRPRIAAAGDARGRRARVVAFGLLASGVAVTSIRGSTLINRVDDSCTTRPGAGRRRRAGCRPLRRRKGRNPSRPPSDFYVRSVGPRRNGRMAVNDRDARPGSARRHRRRARADHRRLGQRPTCSGGR